MKDVYILGKLMMVMMMVIGNGCAQAGRGDQSRQHLGEFLLHV